jgi:serine phosphatase RsbU (regulator of sigma subunit)
MERLLNVIKDHLEKSAKEIRQAVISDVQHYIGSQALRDDLTLVVLKQK